MGEWEKQNRYKIIDVSSIKEKQNRQEKSKFCQGLVLGAWECSLHSSQDTLLSAGSYELENLMSKVVLQYNREFQVASPPKMTAAEL